jgi:hypothetical protein
VGWGLGGRGACGGGGARVEAGSGMPRCYQGERRGERRERGVGLQAVAEPERRAAVADDGRLALPVRGAEGEAKGREAGEARLRGRKGRGVRRKGRGRAGGGRVSPLRPQPTHDNTQAGATIRLRAAAWGDGNGLGRRRRAVSSLEVTLPTSLTAVAAGSVSLYTAPVARGVAGVASTQPRREA